VELNAMTAPVFIDFLERKLAEQGVRKIMPEREILERHARRVIEQRLVDKVLRENRSTVQADPTKPYVMWPGLPYGHRMLPVR
jgi:hypothetical protein